MTSEPRWNEGLFWCKWCVTKHTKCFYQRGNWIHEDGRETHAAEPGRRVQMVKQRSWWVCDMDEGVLNVLTGRAEAVEWICHHWGGVVTARHTYAPGSYDYWIGSGDDESSVVSIVREDMLGAYGLSDEHRRKWEKGMRE